MFRTKQKSTFKDLEQDIISKPALKNRDTITPKTNRHTHIINIGRHLQFRFCIC